MTYNINMSYVKFLYLLAACTIFLSSCAQHDNHPQFVQEVVENANGKVDSASASPTVDLEHFTFEKNDDKSKVSVRVFIELPKADGAALTKIRKCVLALLDGDGDTPQTCFNNHARNFIQEYGMPEDFENEYMEDLSSLAEDSIWADKVTPQFIQFRTYSYSYIAGAAHGICGYMFHVFDLNTGKKLTDEDVFTDVEAIENLLKTTGYKNYLKENGLTESNSQVDKTGIGANGNWGMDGDNLIYIFNPYEIAPYSEGVLTFPLNKKLVKPYMKQSSALYKYWFGEEEDVGLRERGTRPYLRAESSFN